VFSKQQSSANTSILQKAPYVNCTDGFFAIAKHAEIWYNILSSRLIVVAHFTSPPPERLIEAVEKIPYSLRIVSACSLITL
jgi:hypothetical protein